MKVAVVHHSLEQLESLEAAIQLNGEHECVWVAVDGRGIAARCRANPPDVLLVDVTLKNPTAAEITRAVVETNTCGVVVVGSRPSSSEAYDAMGAGALDVVPLPGDDGASRGDARFLSTRLNKIGRVLTPIGTRRPASSNGAVAAPTPPPRVLMAPDPGRIAATAARTPRLVAIGASTGGPQAIHQLLASLPKPLTCAIAIVQHIEGIFAAGMTEWLSEDTGVSVKLATPGMRLEAGTALLSGNEGHLVLTRSGTFTYSDEPKNSIHRPSIDCFFQSLAEHHPAPGMAVLLTGMGQDGAVGLHTLRSKGWRTIAQDEATSVVFGMPKAAIRLGAAERTLPIGEIGPTIRRWLTG